MMLHLLLLIVFSVCWEFDFGAVVERERRESRLTELLNLRGRQMTIQNDRKSSRAQIERLEDRRLMATDLGNVLFLGDSITHGAWTHDSYRYEFWKNLIDPPAIPGSSDTHDFDFDFVGSQATFNNAPTKTLPDHLGLAFPNIHEGHGGWTTNAILNGGPDGKLSDWLAEYEADLALIHLATNDLRSGLIGFDGSVPSADRLEQIVKQIQTDNPNVTLLVAQIIPYYRQNTDITVEQYNDNIDGFNQIVADRAAGWSTTTSRVYVVNHNRDPNDPSQRLPISYFVDGSHLNELGTKVMADRWFNSLMDIPPTVTDIRVNSTSWSSDFRDAIDSTGMGYRIPNGNDQSKPLPWTNLDQLLVTFDEEVTIDESDVSMAGVFGGPYSFPEGSVSFDDTTNTATITLPPNLTRDSLTLTIADTVTDLNGNALDGEWVNQQVHGRSGDGQPHSDFVFTFNVLPGDVTQDAFVTGSDISYPRENRFAFLGLSDNYDMMADLDGDGFLSGSDIAVARENRFSNLIPPAPAKVDQLFAQKSKVAGQLRKRHSPDWLVDSSTEESQRTRAKFSRMASRPTRQAFLA